MQTEYEIITGENIKRLDNGSIVNRYSHVIKGAHIGDNVMIGEHCYIARTAVISNNSKIQNSVSVNDSVVIGKNVFIGQNVCFVNRTKPSVCGDNIDYDKIVIADNVSILSNSTICAPCKIGNGALIGAGSVILKDIPAGSKSNGIVKKKATVKKKQKGSK